MAHDQEPLTSLPNTATLRDVIEKLNEVIQRINYHWYPETDED